MERLTEWKDDKKLLAKTKFSGDFGLANILIALAEYEDLDEQGLLLRLPCKVGDTVWRIFIPDNYIMPCNVEEFVYSNSLYIVVREEFFNTRRGWNINEIGKTVFLTKAEAEQKLKEWRTNKDLVVIENEKENNLDAEYELN